VRSYAEAQAAGRPFDIVVLDLTVPGGMGGKDALAELRSIDPNVCAVATSGYSQDPIMSDHQAYGFVAVLPKPYDVETFLFTIDRTRRH
jgi:DNA-binding NarL/FixJ family response regulator